MYRLRTAPLSCFSFPPTPYLIPPRSCLFNNWEIRHVGSFLTFPSQPIASFHHPKVPSTMAATLHAQANGTAEPQQQKPRSKLLVCFDGTGNQYSGNTSDTNVVKLYQKFDRDAPHQYHYYQRKSTRRSVTVGSDRWLTALTSHSGDRHLFSGRRLAQCRNLGKNDTFDFTVD